MLALEPPSCGWQTSPARRTQPPPEGSTAHISLMSRRVRSGRPRSCCAAEGSYHLDRRPGASVTSTISCAGRESPASRNRSHEPGAEVRPAVAAHRDQVGRQLVRVPVDGGCDVADRPFVHVDLDGYAASAELGGLLIEIRQGLVDAAEVALAVNAAG